MTRLLLADDHAVLRRGMARLLADEPDLEVVGEASTGAECLELQARLLPDLVLLDLSMPGSMSGLEVARLLRQRSPACAVVILSSECRPDLVRDLLGSGVKGYVSKTSGPGEVVRAIQVASQGKTYLSPEAAEALVQAVRRPAGLAGRQREVLELSAQGLTMKEIGARLNLSPKTIEKIRSSILHEMGVRNTVEAVEAARRSGML